jgi:hypothetical protein
MSSRVDANVFIERSQNCGVDTIQLLGNGLEDLTHIGKERSQYYLSSKPHFHNSHSILSKSASFVTANRSAGSCYDSGILSLSTSHPLFRKLQGAAPNFDLSSFDSLSMPKQESLPMATPVRVNTNGNI